MCRLIKIYAMLRSSNATIDAIVAGNGREILGILAMHLVKLTIELRALTTSVRQLNSIVALDFRETRPSQ